MKGIFLLKKIILIITGALLFLAAVYQLVQNVSKEQVKIWDEAFTAQNAIEMLENGNCLVIHYDGEPDHVNTRPPMAVWTKVISYKLFGINEFSVRFPSLVASILTLLVLMIFALKFLRDPLFAFIMLILAASTAGYMHYHVARTGDPESLLTFFVTCYLILYFILLEKYPGNRVLYLILTGTAVVMAAWTKSIAGLSPLAGVAVYTLLQKRGHRVLKDWRFHVTWVATLMVILTYYLAREILDPGYLQAVVRMEFSIITDPYVIKHPRFDYYFTYLQDLGFPPFMNFWFIPLIPLVAGKNNVIRRLLLYALLGGGIYLLGMSSATLKNEWYIAPVYPFLWIWFGAGLAGTLRIISRFFRKERIRQMVIVLLFLAFAWYSYPVYMEVLDKNYHAATTDYIYPPERTGRFLNEVKKGEDDLDSIKIIEYEPPRQVKFYMKKYEYLEGTDFTLYNKYPDSGLYNSHVIVCGDSLRDRIRSEYHHEVIREGKYCTLYKTGEAKSRVFSF